MACTARSYHVRQSASQSESNAFNRSAQDRRDNIGETHVSQETKIMHLPTPTSLSPIPMTYPSFAPSSHSSRGVICTRPPSLRYSPKFLFLRSPLPSFPPSLPLSPTWVSSRPCRALMASDLRGIKARRAAQSAETGLECMKRRGDQRRGGRSEMAP